MANKRKDEKALMEMWLDKLKEEKKLIVVEGIKDKRALSMFGLDNIYQLERKPLYMVAEDIAFKAKEVILFVDLDSEGKKIFGKLNSWLQERGVKVDNSFREFLFRNTVLRQIEGMPSYIANLQIREHNGKNREGKMGVHQKIK